MAHLRAALWSEAWANEVVLVVSGVGMANAAAAAERVIAEHSPRAVLNYGCAGAHRADLRSGDLIVGTRVVAYLDAETPIVECDEQLIEAARRVAHNDVKFGTVASADAWNRVPQVIQELAVRHGSVCEDMEAAAIGLVCKAHQVPFLTIKDISNNELVQGTLSAEHMLAQVGRDQIARRAAECTYAVLRDQAYSMSRF